MAGLVLHLFWHLHLILSGHGEDEHITLLLHWLKGAVSLLRHVDHLVVELLLLLLLGEDEGFHIRDVERGLFEERDLVFHLPHLEGNDGSRTT